MSDLIRPSVMDGLAFPNEARPRRPGLPVILVPGCSTSAARATELGYSVYMKPLDMAELAKGIRAQLSLGGRHMAAGGRA